jgi:hypothetical protein
MNVISLSGASGVGENIVTLGLGPSPSAPPPPGPGPSEGGSAAYAEGVWRQRWRKIAEERLREQLLSSIFDRPLPFTELPTAPSGESTSPVEPTDEVPTEEAGYVVLPVGQGAAVRAPATGTIWYRYTALHGLAATLESESGVRYLIVNLARASKRSGVKVVVGDVIGISRPRLSARGAHALLGTKEREGAYVVDEQSGGVGSTRIDVETLFLGSAASGVLWAVGAPMLAAFTMGGTVVFAFGPKIWGKGEK